VPLLLEELEETGAELDGGMNCRIHILVSI
jgi:hypothetical protein